MRSPHLRTLHLTLHDGERVWKKDALIVSVGNGAYIGGGMKATPFADPFDGLFEVSVVSSISRAKFLRLLPSFIKGEHTGLPEGGILPAQRSFMWNAPRSA